MNTPAGRIGTFISWCLLAVIFAGAATAQKIEYARTHRDVLRRRLTNYGVTNAERKEKLYRLFEEVGCRGEHLTEQTVKSSKLPNVICTLPGETEQVILIGAHFDAVASGNGVVDNWTGTVLLPTLYESLKAVPRRHTFVFVGFAEEEKGLIGSRFYVKKLGREGRKNVSAMVNLDCLGLSTTKVWVSRGDKDLVGYSAMIGRALNLPIDGVNIERVGSSDSESFRRRGVPVIMFHSATQETAMIPNSSEDTLEAVRLDDYYDTYMLVASYATYIDLKLDPEPLGEP